MEGNKNGGIIITIKGEGFSTIPNQNKVSIGGEICPIISGTRYQIECKIPQKPSTLHSNNQQMGLERLIFKSTKVGDLESEFPNFEGYESRNMSLGTYVTNDHNNNNNDNMEVEVIRGYFRPPHTGSYEFFVVNIEETVVNFGEGSSSKSRIITAPENKNNIKRRWDRAQSSSKYLVEGSAYYIEIIHRVYGGYVILGYEMENTSPNTEHNRKQVQVVSINAHVIHEEHHFTLKDPPPYTTSTYYKWMLFMNNGGTYQSDPIYPRASALQFRESIRSAFNNLQVTVTVVLKSITGEGMLSENMKTDMNIGSITYIVAIISPHADDLAFLSADIPPQPILPYTSTLKEENFHYYSDHSYTLPLTGHFTLLFQYNLEIYTLGPISVCEGAQDIINMVEDKYPKDLTGVLDIYILDTPACGEVYEVAFEFIGCTSNVPLLEFSNSGTSIYGGHPTERTMEIREVQTFSNNIYMQFIAPELLYVEGSSGVGVSVESNSVPSACPTLDCSFRYTESTIPVMREVKYIASGRVVEITYRPIVENIENIYSIWVGDTECNAVSRMVVMNEEIGVSCRLTKEPIGGSYYPVVSYSEGYWGVEEGLSPIVIGYSIDEISPSEGLNPSGGQVLTFSGHSLPYTLEQGRQHLEVMVDGGTPIPILYSQNNYFTILTPQFISHTPVITLVLNGLTQEISGALKLTSNTFPTLLSVHPTSGSTVFRKYIIITRIYLYIYMV